MSVLRGPRSHGSSWTSGTIDVGRRHNPCTPNTNTAVGSHASLFTFQDGAVYQTYATTWRGVEFLMGFYPILDRTPKGPDEGDAFQVWIRRHDEYEAAYGLADRALLRASADDLLSGLEG